MRLFTSFVIVTSFFGIAARAQERILLPVGDSDVPGTSPDREGRTLAVPVLETDHVSIRERDGRWTLSVRVQSPGAAGLQLFIEGLRLPEGAKLALYEIEANGGLGRLAAEYDRVGPLQGDSFWTTPVAGSEARLEVTLAGGAAGDLPLQLTRLRHLSPEGLAKFIVEPPPPNRRTAELEGTRGFARFRGAVVPFDVRDGLALFEGDMILGPAEEIQAVSSKEQNGQRQSMGITSAYNRWTAGVVPYEIDPTLPSQYRITDAIAHWNTQLAGTIIVRPRNGETDYVRFVNSANAGSCSSYIGNVHVAGQAITLGANCSTGNTIHELGHAIGLFHEHTREDRNTFVLINFANIDPTKTSNFNQAITTSDDLGAYDYGSIMHYPSTAFSINGLPTIVSIPDGIAMGQRTALSAGDAAGVRTMYPPSAPPSTVAYTVASNPSGRQLTVDGITVTAPVTYQWTAGTVHSVSAPNSTVGTTRYLFNTWSDAGAQTHSVTVPASATAITANFQKQYSLTSASSNTALGSVGNSPVAADTFYNDGTAVSVTGTPVGAACLASWSGVSAPPSTPISVNVNLPYSITGNFQTGSVSAAPLLVSIPPSGATSTVTVTATTGCVWTAKSNASWITITSGASGTSSGTVSFSVGKKNGKSSRTGTLSIGSILVTVNQ